MVIILMFVGSSTGGMGRDCTGTPYSYPSCCGSFYLSLVVEDLFW